MATYTTSKLTEAELAALHARTKAHLDSEACKAERAEWDDVVRAAIPLWQARLGSIEFYRAWGDSWHPWFAYCSSRPNETRAMVERAMRKGVQ